MYNPPVRIYGCTRICVKEFTGAKGDGITDDTAAFQKAVDTLPAAGGIVHVPAGTYLIDGVKSVRLRSKMLFEMDPGAVLKIKPNSAVRYYALVVEKEDSEVEIAGGAIVGERDEHTYVDTGNSTRTHEWGMGIGVRGGSKVTIRDVKISNCTGDGICLNGKELVVARVVCLNNRRQGLSITAGSDVVVQESEFGYTNGTSPECGIDIEPDLPATTTRVLIENCKMYNNAKYGLNVWANSDSVTVKGCEFMYNTCGIVTQRCTNVVMTGNHVHHNTATGIFIQAATGAYLIEGNTFGFNYSRQGLVNRTDFVQTGWTSKVQKDILLRSELTGKVGQNSYY